MILQVLPRVPTMLVIGILQRVGSGNAIGRGVSSRDVDSDNKTGPCRGETVVGPRVGRKSVLIGHEAWLDRQTLSPGGLIPSSCVVATWTRATR